MSGEFGSCDTGYFHRQIEMAAEDCLAGSDELTRLWGEFFRVLYPVAKAISWSEAGDSGPDKAILECTRAMPAFNERLAEIDKYLTSFRRTPDIVKPVDARRTHIEDRRGAKPL